jgi:hypothetical protein
MTEIERLKGVIKILEDDVKDRENTIDAHDRIINRDRERIRELEKALTEIYEIRWGYDGDCGALSIVDSVLDT